MIASSRITNVVESGGFALTAGVVPPSGADSSSLKTAAQELVGRVQAVVVSDGGEVSMAGLAACMHLSSAGMEPVLELSTRDMNRIALQSVLIGAASIGVSSVICSAGVHQTLTTSKAARGVFDLDPVQLIRTTHNMNHGTDLLIGTIVNPASDPMELQIIGLRKAVQAGARFVITAPIFNMDRMEKWMAMVRDEGLQDKVHIIAGVMPLETSDEALELREKYRAFDIPDKIVEKIGIDFAAETARSLAKVDGVRGIHIYAAGEGRTAKVLDAAGLKINA